MKKILLLLLFPIAVTLSGCVSTNGIAGFDDRALLPVNSQGFKEFCADRGAGKQVLGLLYDTVNYPLGEISELANAREKVEDNPITQSVNRKCREME